MSQLKRLTPEIKFPEDEGGELLQIEDMLPSPDAGPEALYVRHVLLEELEFALAELLGMAVQEDEGDGGRVGDGTLADHHGPAATQTFRMRVT